MQTSAAAKPRVRVPAGGVAFPNGLPQRSAPQSSYMRADKNSQIMFRWNPALRESSEDVRSAWKLAVARTVDQFHNSGWLAGAAEQSMTQVVGRGLLLNAKPNAAALGKTQGEADAWARDVEARWSMYCDSPRSCDASGRSKLGQMQGQAYRHWMATGEILATLPMRQLPGTGWATKLRLFPAWRMSQKSEGADLVQGVRIDPFGAPRSYVLNVKDIYGSFTEREFAANDAYGRPMIRHIFDGEPDQVRGITPFVSVLKVMRQFDQLADATLTTTLIQTVFAAMFKSEMPTEDVLAGLKSDGEQRGLTEQNADGSSDASQLLLLQAEKAKFYNNADIDLGVHGKVLHGFPGDELQFLSAEHPNGNYEPFAKFLLRECSRAAAVTYEEFTGDWAGATFSSAKMGVATNWPRVLYRRDNIVAPLCQTVYEAWLEEDIEMGGTPFPGGVAGFLEKKEAACQAFWRGPTMPQADELKSALAAKTKLEIGLPKSLVFSEYGIDPDDAADERRRERDYEGDLGPGTVFASAVDLAAAAKISNDGAEGDDPDETKKPKDGKDKGQK